MALDPRRRPAPTGFLPANGRRLLLTPWEKTQMMEAEDQEGISFLHCDDALRPYEF